MFNDVGTVVSHCRFNDAPHFAIRYESNNSVIEYCEFFDVCLDTADTGAVYTGRRWETRGNEIRYNYFHDLSLKTATGHGVQAVYLDDMSSSTDVYGNVFFNVDRAALIGGGRYNKFRNNIILNCKASVTVDARATDWASTGTNLSELKNVPYTGEIWAKAYPELVGILDDEPEIPKHNTLENNVLYDTPPFSLNAYVTQYGTVKNNITTADQNLFANPGECDFTLNKNGEIFILLPDFEDIPYIGLHRSCGKQDIHF